MSPRRLTFDVRRDSGLVGAFQQRRVQRTGGNCRMKISLSRGLIAAALVTGTLATGALFGGIVGAAAPQPFITSVTFSGQAGPNVASPTITLIGTHFGANPPAGTSDATTSCGTYANNGNVYGSKLYFEDDNFFEAGFNNSLGATCIGIIVDSWSSTKVVLHFGNAYGGFDHWYLSNGDGFAISVKTAIFGGAVSGLS
jgi:hypothetical protein